MEPLNAILKCLCAPVRNRQAVKNRAAMERPWGAILKFAQAGFCWRAGTGIGAA